MLEGKSVLEVYQFDLLKKRKKIMILQGDISENLYFARELSFLYILDSLYIINL